MTGPQVPLASDARFDLDSERLGPLPLVNAFLQRMGLETMLNRSLTPARRNSRFLALCSYVTL